MAEGQDESMNTSLQGLSLEDEDQRELVAGLANTFDQNVINGIYNDSTLPPVSGLQGGEIPSSSNTLSESKSRRQKSRDEARMDVTVKNKMIRLRYDSELTNRNIGKEELVQIKFHNVPIESTILIRVHAVDKDNQKAHPYCLIGDKCHDGIYTEHFKQTRENDRSCIVKATVKIPKRKDYEEQLKCRKRRMEKDIGVFLAECKKSDYWSANKSIKECQSLRLCVEAFYQKDRQSYLLHRITDPLNNAKDGKTFQIHTIRPCAAPCTGIPIESLNDYMLIVLSADSFEPKKGVEVWIVDHTGWREKARNISIIRNVIECEIPPYKESTLESPVGVKLFLRDVNKDMDSNKVNFQYTPTEGVVIDSKKRKVHYDNIPNHVKEEAEKEKCRKETVEKVQRKIPRKRIAAKHSTNRSSTHSNGVSSTAPSPFSDASNDQAPAGVFNFIVNSPSNGQANLNSNPSTGVDFLVDDMFGLGNLKTENQLSDQMGNVASFSTSVSQNMPQSQVDVQASVVYQGFVQNVQTVPSLQATQQNSFVPNQIPVTQPQVQSPTFNPNRGKFKTVTCDTTGQTFILDQNNKVILVMGGNGGVEANEIPEYKVSSPEDLSMMLSPQPQNNSPPLQGSTPQLQGNFQSSGPQGMSSAVNPLLVTGAVDIQVTQQQPHIDLNSTSTAMSGNQNFTQSFFLTPSEVANSNFVDFNRLPSRDLQMDGADSLSIQEVVVTTSTTNTKEEFPQELGEVILQGDEESSDNDVHQVSEREDSASNSSSGEGEKESAENSKTSGNDDLDNVMNSLSSLEILEREGDNKKSSGDLKKKD